MEKWLSPPARLFLRSQPGEGRGGGRTTHKSASILSVARCGASSTE